MPAPAPVDTLARIETPENVWLTFRLAGLPSRMLAYTLDLSFRAIFLVAMSVVISILSPFLSFSGLSAGVFLVLMFLLEWGYGTIFEAFWGGKTPGKHILKLRVVKTGGCAISFYDSMLRNLLRAVDVLPFFYGVGLVSVLLTRRMQRLGDLVAGTIVVREKRPRLHEARAWLRDVAPLPRPALLSGYRVPERTLALIDSFARRRSEMHSARADEVASILATPLGERLGPVGLEDQHLREPSEFLLRVLKTYTETPAVQPSQPVASPSTDGEVSGRGSW